MATVKTAISLPQDVYKRATAAAKKARISRSELFRLALTKYLSREESHAMTKLLDHHLEEHPLTRSEVRLGRASGKDVAEQLLKDLDW